MLVELGVRREHYQQAAATKTTTITITTSPSSRFSKTFLKHHISHDQNVKTTNPQSDTVNHHLATTVVSPSIEQLNLNYLKSLHNSSTPSSGVSHSSNFIDSQKRQSYVNKHLSQDTHLQKLNKEPLQSSSSFLTTDSNQATSKDTYVELSTSSRSSDVTVPTVSSHSCSLKLIIEEVNVTLGSNPQVICWGTTSWQNRIPIVFQCSVPTRITYVWDRHSQSDFTLDFSCLKPEEVDNCLFQCNNHLCLLRKQLCNGDLDCPDHSNEQNSACLLARQQEENGEPGVIKEVIIIISVIVGIIIVLALVFMINHCRCYEGAHRGGGPLLQLAHSHSSEVCQSPSGSVQESGQYEPMVHPHPRQHTDGPPLTVASSHCSEHQQLLHPNQPEVEQHHRYVHHTSRNHCVGQHHYMSQEHHIRSLTSNAEGAADNPRANRPQHHHQLQQLQHKYVHHQQQQQRQCKQAHKHVSPNELYPPNIPLSADGEEGYVMSQKSLHSKQQLERNWQVENEVFRPPPNKTVYDRDSPPPPYSLNPPGTKSLDSLVPPLGTVCVLRQTGSSLMHPSSSAGVPRSHSLSCHQ